MNDQSANFIRVADETTDVLAKFVVPLYVEEKGRPIQLGSGFFVRAGAKTFLVSAAHVLQLGTALFYYIEPNITARVSGKRRMNPRDEVDVATVELDGPAPPFRKVDKYAVDLSYLRPRLLPRDDKIYTIIGFPATQSKLDPVRGEVEVTAYAYRSRSIRDADYPGLNIAPHTHVGIRMDLRTGVDSGGKQRTFPKPRGMSGAPIWILVEEGPATGERSFPIVAVGTRYKRSEKVLIGTDIDIVIDMINAAAV